MDTIRNDAFLFYSLSAISFLESTVPEYVENLSVIYKDDPKLVEWLSDVWLAEEAEHGRLAKALVNKTWPDFDWQSAYDAFLKLYQPQCHFEKLRPSPALEALSRRVTETETSMLYRCIERYSNNADVKRLMKKMSTDEVRHYREFRKVYERHERIEENTLWRKAKTILQRSELVRDEDLLVAFQPLNDNWQSPKPFTEMNFNQFMKHTGHILEEHFPVEEARRMLFKPIQTKGTLNKIFINVLALLVKRQYPQLT